MTLQDLGSIGELIAAIATVATLAYLAVQIRQSTIASRTAALDETARSFSRWRQQISSDRSVAEVWLRGLADPEALDAVDRVRFEFLMSTYFFSLQALYHRAKSAGSLDAWKNAQLALRGLVANPGALRYWSTSQERFGADFRAAVNRVVDASVPAA